MQLLASYGENLPEKSKWDVIRQLSKLRNEVGSLPGRKWNVQVCHRDPLTILKEKEKDYFNSKINRAFFKLHELSDELPRYAGKVLNLCEAPGGFWQASKSIWKNEVIATSMVCEIEFHKSVNFLEGLPKFGDVREDEVKDWIEEKLGAHSCDIITADGGVGHEDADVIEQKSFPLLLAQLILSLRMQKQGGCIVLKLFEGSTKPTRDVVAIVKSLYKEWSVEKPSTSKAANSERYLIGRELIDVKETDLVVQQLSEIENYARATTQNVHSILPTDDECVDGVIRKHSQTQVNEIWDMLTKSRRVLKRKAYNEYENLKFEPM